MKKRYDEYDSLGLAVEPDRFGDGVMVWLWGFGTYEPHSVLAGQPMISRLEAFTSLEDARRAWPDVEVLDYVPRPVAQVSQIPPRWFDPAAAGERWDEDEW